MQSLKVVFTSMCLMPKTSMSWKSIWIDLKSQIEINFNLKFCFFGTYKTKIVCITPLTPDRRHVKRPPPSLQITSNFLVFYVLSYGTTLENKGVAQNLTYSKIWPTISWNCCVCLENINIVKLAKFINFWLLTN